MTIVIERYRWADPNYTHPLFTYVLRCSDCRALAQHPTIIALWDKAGCDAARKAAQAKGWREALRPVYEDMRVRVNLCPDCLRKEKT